MGSRKRAGARAKARRIPVVEGLERREVFSVAPIFARAALRAQALQTRSIDAFLQARQNLYPPGNPQPTARELAKEKFVAKFVGTYETGEGRFTDQFRQVGVLAAGGSNQSLHMSTQMVLFLPADPNAAPSGAAALFPKNVAETGTLLALDLTAPPTGALGQVPNEWTWTVNGNSGGIYLNAGGNGIGQGTMSIKLYPQRGTRSYPAGKAVVVFKGLIKTGGIFNDISIPGTRSKRV